MAAMGEIEGVLEKLVAEGVVQEDAVRECVREAEESGTPLLDVVLMRNVVPVDRLMHELAVLLGMEYMSDLSTVSVPHEFIERVPIQFARRHSLVAVGERDECMLVAVAPPFDPHPVDDVALLVGRDVEPVLASREEIQSLISQAYQAEAAVEQIFSDLEEEEFAASLEEDSEVGTQDLLDIANKAPIIKLVNTIISEALRLRASDIHIQPYEDSLHVRYRIDGILYDTMTPPKKYQEAIISRVKVMGRMDIAERRLPQDGRASVRIGDREVDIRISTVPTVWGERVVMRLLDKGKKLFVMEELGLYPEQLELFRKITSYSHGMIFVTGPTGSGKTTTLNAVLNHINSPEKNIITIEDPIEYHIVGISQMEVSTKKGMTFATGLRHILRQDPDIIMVGEVRDLETARISVQAALTGHLVLSTLHTNDSAGAVTRLIDLGVEPYLVSSSLIAVVAQRLVRLICNECKREYRPDEAVLRNLGLDASQYEGKTFWRGVGCDACLGRGFMGRTGIFEILVVDDEIRGMIKKNATAGEIRQAASRNAYFSTLRMDGVRKVLDGLTTPEEVLKVTQLDLF